MTSALALDREESQTTTVKGVSFFCESPDAVDETWTHGAMIAALWFEQIEMADGYFRVGDTG